MNRKKQRINHIVNTISKQLVKPVIFFLIFQNFNVFYFDFIYTSTLFSRLIDIRLVKHTVLSLFHLDIRYLSQLFYMSM